MAGPDDTDDNRKVKDLLDPATRAELERWFRIPSFEQVADGAAPAAEPDDPALAEYRKRVAEALAAIDPEVLASYERRLELAGTIIKPEPPPPVVPNISRLDLSMIARTVAEPRDYTRSEMIEDDLRDCTPQALLRDLHRPDVIFDKVFEVDPDAAKRFDGTAVVEQAMATDWRLRQFPVLAHADGRTAFEELRAERRQPWAALKLPNRTVTE